MQDYLLFVDTETTGLPAGWRRPYADDAAWPHLAQLAWVVYTRAGALVKTENHYLRVPAGTMQPTAQAIHGLSAEFLAAEGKALAPVLGALAADLARYRPLVVGHFVQLDFHMLGVGFHRAGLPNPLPGLPTFCTMLPTGPLARALGAPPGRALLRLNELYEHLFHEHLDRHHDAQTDAEATAECFFELWRTGYLTEASLGQQAPLTVPVAAGPFDWLGPPRRRAAAAAAGALLLLVLAWLYYHYG
ncbi:MAG: 3'-5' exonuclease [Janthinobacterium lividum]